MVDKESDEYFLRICEYLHAKKIDFKVLEHEAVRTSEEAAKVRNNPL